MMSFVKLMVVRCKSVCFPDPALPVVIGRHGHLSSSPEKERERDGVPAYYVNLS
jgi:hypothetical protein